MGTQPSVSAADAGPSAAGSPSAATSAASAAATALTEQHAILVNEARYAERLCQRTARLYRRLQAIGTFGAVLGGSATLAALAPSVHPAVSAAGAVLFAVFGAALLAIRPADKAAQNEADVRRYAKLRTEAVDMNVDQLQRALRKAQETDTAEVESLRVVAYNDVLREIGRESQSVALRPMQRLLMLVA